MKYYKELLRDKLFDSGWELMRKDDDTDWWLESYWEVKSVKQNYGKLIYVLFLVDPQYDGENKEGAIWAISAFEKVPLERPSQDGIASTYLVKGKLNECLSIFVNQINSYRNNENS